jgi:DNA-binding phage protein
MDDKDTAKYKAGLMLIAQLGDIGAELSDFVKTYGTELSAVQLGVKHVELKKFLLSAGDMAGVARTLREVMMRQRTQRVPITEVQRANFVSLVGVTQKRFGMTALSRKLGVTRQALYHVAQTGGPTFVSDVMLGYASLLGYANVTSFLAALTAGVPDHSHIKITKRKGRDVQ